MAREQKRKGDRYAFSASILIVVKVSWTTWRRQNGSAIHLCQQTYACRFCPAMGCEHGHILYPIHQDQFNWRPRLSVSCWINYASIKKNVANLYSILAALISIIEVLSIVAVFIYASLRSDDDTNSTFKEKCLRVWFWFLFISPFVTGTMVVLMASDISCDPEDDLDMHQPICQVGIRLIKATALCRAGIM